MVSTQAAETFEREWKEALSGAFDAARAPTGSHLFVERRRGDDLRFDAAGGVVHEVRDLEGWAVRLGAVGAWQLHAADPSPDRAARFVASALERSTAEAGRASSEVPVRLRSVDSGLDPRVSRLIEILPRLEGRGTLSVRWSTIDQQVAIGRPGHEPLTERRRGGRLRVGWEVQTRAGTLRPQVDIPLAPGTPPPVGEIREALERRLARYLDARPARPGRQAVVFGPGAAGVVIHELVVHPLEADHAGASWLSRGEAVGSELLTVVDDPRRCRLPWRIDDEGEPSRPVGLVRRGRVTGELCDQRAALAGGGRSTGHGRRASFAEPVLPRSGCAFIAAGDADADEVIAETAQGLYVRELSLGGCDVARGHAWFLVSDADRIVDGRLAGPLAPCALAIDAREALVSLDRVANDLAFDTSIGNCVKGGQAMVASVGAPTIRLGVVGVQN